MNAERLTLRAWLSPTRPHRARRPHSASRTDAGVVSPRIRSTCSAAILVALIVVAIVGPLIMPHDPLRQVLSDRLLPPGSPSHWLGTDQLGRDILSRLIAGSRLTLGIAILVVVIVVPIGLLIGTTAGYCGGFVDSVLMRITDIALAFPKIVLALAFAAALGPGVINAVVAISITAWPAYARLARAETIRIAQADFIHAARLQGASAAHPAALYHAVHVVGDRARDARHGRHHPDRRGPRLLGLGAQPPAPNGASWSRRGATCCSTRGGSRRCPAARFCS